MKLRRLAAPLLLALVCALGTGETALAANKKTKGAKATRSQWLRRPVDSFETRLQTFIRESGGAQVIERGFAPVKDGVPAAPRRMITVSRASFDAFARQFSGPDVLFVYHAPNSRNIATAFNGFQGTQGRLREAFRYNFPGTLLIPILLTPEESSRAHDFFRLAGQASRSRDIALFPWLLKGANNVPYMREGNANLNSEWFMRMPIGAAFDESERRESFSTEGLSPEAATLAQRVWTAPYGHQTLAQVLDLRPADPVRQFKTPGMVANALLSTASPERVPVVFRFIEDYAIENPDLGNYIDSDFDPGERG